MDDLSEKEQIERIRGWWNENGNYVIVGVVVGVGLLFGINYWRNQTLNTQLGASIQFEELANEVAENRLEPAQAIAAGIYAQYPDTIYAAQTRLAMARLYMDQGRDQEASDELRALLASGGDSEMQLVGPLTTSTSMPVRSARSGRVVTASLDERTVGLPLSELRGKCTLGLAAGPGRGPVALGALRAACIETFVTEWSDAS